MNSYELHRSDRPFKTTKYFVVKTIHGNKVGIVMWSTVNREYCFIPSGTSMFTPDCLQEISNHIINEVN